MKLRFWLCVFLVAIGLSGCGGGGGGGDVPQVTMEGTIVDRSIASTSTGAAYPLRVYLPPASAGPRSGLPVVYALDGDNWFNDLVTIAESTKSRIVVVGIGNNARRNIDYVPVNSCTGGGGGNEAFLKFIRQELTPFVEGTIGGDPARRILIGHSHGGTFVLYALFAEAPQAHHFRSYLASDSSIDCAQSAVAGWEGDYAAAYTSLPVRVHISHANNQANLNFAARLASRNHGGLVLKEQGYAGTHTGIIPAAFRDAIAFALGN